jgi:pimeloyl-ACP methyl ester carboxylesterase/predicted glycosyltransferase
MAMQAVHADTAGAREQTRARQPDQQGYAERDGVRVFWERYGDGEPAFLLPPTWEIVHSRSWKCQIPYLARHGRVVTFDPRGNGRSDRPRDYDAYRRREFAGDAVAVLDAAGVERAIVVAWCDMGESLILAAEHPERVAGLVLIAPALPVREPEVAPFPFDEPLDTEEGWAKENRHYWLRDWRGYLEWFFSQCFTEPHSTKQIEDCVGWGLETDAETILAGFRGWATKELDPETTVKLCARVRCPTLVVQGTEDELVDPEWAVALAGELGSPLIMLEGVGHAPHARDPVWTNLLLRDFAERLAPSGSRELPWTRALRRRRRTLYLSSPIGLGHARRDIAIAQELRELDPDLEVDWLAQDPVTRLLEDGGERIHPASRLLASESRHIEREAGDHDLHCFQAIRRMDEILVANFMVFHEVVADGNYDLVVGDEAWDVDYYWHENPELKRTAFGWMTDFVGWLPMPDGGEREAALTADYNAEMIEQVARYPRIRDRAIFVGNPDDIVPLDFGPGLPQIREWTEQHYAFAGYVTGFDPARLGDRQELRERLGWRPEERVVVVTVGGSGVGLALLQRVVASFPEAARAVDGLRMVAVAGPRIDPNALQAPADVQVVGHVPDLYRHLAACDLAVVQGGLSTTMELTACRRPFLYFPLHNHFEQNLHVAHRLNRYRAGHRMDYATSTPESIADAIAAELGRQVDYRPVETNGAIRAATLLAELL